MIADLPCRMARRRDWQANREDHVHDDIELDLLFDGEVRLIHGGTAIDIPRRRWLMLWAGIPHHPIHIRPIGLAWVMVPLAQALRWDLGPAFSRMLAGGLVIAPTADTADEPMVDRWEREVPRPGGPLPPPACLEVEALVRRLAAVPPGRASVAVAEPGVVERLVAIIGRCFTEELDTATVARAAGVHPKYAMAAFRAATGMTMWTYLRRRRVAEAQRLLLTTSWSVERIGKQAGFAATSRFYDSFAAIVGTSPAAWRACRLKQR